jgi:Uma2 family endonuclease
LSSVYVFLRDVLVIFCKDLFKYFNPSSIQECKTMSVPASSMKATLTYRDYLTWPDNERGELIRGVAYDMSPAPAPEHQIVLGELFGELRNFLRGTSCRAYIAPFDVRFPEGNEADDAIETVVQPDISIVCDASKIDRKGCKGAPDIIIEILSPATAKKDSQEKFTLYEHHGVQEYWIVHPSEHLVEVFALGKDQAYGRPKIYAEDDILPVSRFPGLELDLAVVFGIEKPTHKQKKQETGVNKEA